MTGKMEPLEQAVNYWRSSCPIVAIDSPAADERKMITGVCNKLEEALASNPVVNPEVFVFDVISGLSTATINSEGHLVLESVEQMKGDPIAYIFNAMEAKAQDVDARNTKMSVFILLDMHWYIGANPQNIQRKIIRMVKNISHTMRMTRTRILLAGQGMTLVDDLQGIVYQVAEELPGLAEIREFINLLLADYEEDYVQNCPSFTVDLTEAEKERLYKAAQGLTLSEISIRLSLCVVTYKCIDHKTSEHINNAKVEKLQRLNVEFLPAPKTSVGGLGELQRWLQLRQRQFDAQSSGGGVDTSLFPTPKGVLLVGFPGTGKSHVGKAVGAQWGIPVLNVSVGDLFGSLVGESERNLSQLLKTAEAIAPCVLFLDEVEKGLAGASGSQGDGGVAKRMFGKLLSWMNDKQSPVFVVATANDISSLPPEFSRKGRFDEIFFLDVPSKPERIDILKIHLDKYKASLPESDLTLVQEQIDQFTGAEIAGVVDDAALAAYDAGSLTDDNTLKITVADLIAAARATQPFTRREADMVRSLREWAKVSARAASIQEPEAAKKKTTKTSAKVAKGML